MKIKIVFIALMLAATACGSPSQPSSSRASGRPSDKTSEAAGKQEAGGKESKKAAKASSGERENSASGNQGGAPTPVPPVSPKFVVPPHAELYEFKVSGTRQTPAMLAPEDYPDDAIFKWDFVQFLPSGDGGVEFVYKGDLEADALATEDHILFKKAGLRRSFNSITLPGAAWNCKYAPPVAFANAPMKAETYPTQEWKGTGCSGTSDFEVTGFATVVDASGKKWEKLYRIEEKTTYTMQGAKGTITAVHYFAHDKGFDVKTEIKEEGTVTGRPFSYDRTFLLAKLVEPKTQK